MSSPLRWLPLLVVVASLVGCQSAPHGEVDPLTSTASPAGTFSPAPVITELAANRVTLPWHLLGMSADGRRLFITYGVGDGCADYEPHVYVRQTSESVEIASAPTGSGLAGRSPGNACAAYLKTADGYVDLVEPVESCGIGFDTAAARPAQPAEVESAHPAGTSQRQPRAGATWVRIDSMTWAL